MDAWFNLLAGVEFRALPQQLVNGILNGSIYALIALGYTMVYGVLRLINFAHGEVFMLGAYTAFFVSARALGTDPMIAPSTMQLIGGSLIVLGCALAVLTYVAKRSGVRSPLSGWAAGSIGVGLVAFVPALVQPLAINLVLMLLASMALCAVVGVTIEFLAYRPMRDQPRIAILITAIGVSLAIQFGGQLFLPVDPPPAIKEDVNPYRGAIAIPIQQAPADMVAELDRREEALEEATETFAIYLEREGLSEHAVDLPAEGSALKDAEQLARRERNAQRNEVGSRALVINVPEGQLIMLVTAVALMLILRHLVLFTPSGRAMRAVSHDVDSASLMGVNVNRTVTFTFIIGSSLAGAAAMMNATFQATTLDSFYGLLPGVKAFVAAVLGGIGNIPGAALGAMLMGIAESLAVWLGFSEIKDAIAFIILIAVLIFRPGGLLGSNKVEKV